MPTVLDLIVIVVVLISAILAMVRGFVREVLSVASWVAAAAAAYFFYEPVVPFVQPYLEQKTVAVIVSAAAIFFIALVVASYITMKISDFVIDSRIGAVDRAFGFIFGAVRGILLMAIAFFFFGFFVPEKNRPNWVTEARSATILEDIGERLKDAVPQDLEAYIERRRGGGGESTPPAETGERPADGAAPADDPSYGTGERGAIDQLIENSEGQGAPAAGD